MNVGISLQLVAVIIKLTAGAGSVGVVLRQSTIVHLKKYSAVLTVGTSGIVLM